MLDAMLNRARQWGERRRAGRERSQFDARRAAARRDEERLERIEEDRRRYRLIHEQRLRDIETMYGADPAAFDCGERTLVVVDVQPGFIKDYAPLELALLLQTIGAQIRSARECNWPIVFLEFLPAETYDRTYAELFALVDGYGRFARVGKHGRSGCGELLRTCEERAFTTAAFQVVGIYTDQCIYDTVRDLCLNRTMSEIYVVPTACRSWYQVDGNTPLYDWLEFPQRENIHLVPAQTANTAHGYPAVGIINRDRPLSVVEAAVAAISHRAADNEKHTAPPAPQIICP